MTVSKELLHDVIEVLYRHLGPRATPEPERDAIVATVELLAAIYAACGPVMQACPLRGKAPCNRHRQANTEAS